MDNTPEEQEVSTEAQRQALDAMSGELVDKLNHMIEEQNARVQAFATQYPQQAAALQERLQQQEADAPTTPAPLPPAAPPATCPSHVSPPPHKQTRATAPEPAPAAPQPRRAPQPKQEPEKEGSIGCGKLVFIIAVIVILLRCCN